MFDVQRLGFLADTDDLSAASVFRARRLIKGALDDILGFAADMIRRNAPVATGNLRESVRIDEVSNTGDVYRGATGISRAQAPYALYVEKGTGIYGPTPHRIHAGVGNVMAMQILGKEVYAKSTRGQRGQHFVFKAYRETTSVYVRRRLEELRIRLAGIAEKRN